MPLCRSAAVKPKAPGHAAPRAKFAQNRPFSPQDRPKTHAFQAPKYFKLNEFLPTTPAVGRRAFSNSAPFQGEADLRAGVAVAVRFAFAPSS